MKKLKSNMIIKSDNPLTNGREIKVCGPFVLINTEKYGWVEENIYDDIKLVNENGKKILKCTAFKGSTDKAFEIA